MKLKILLNLCECAGKICFIMRLQNGHVYRNPFPLILVFIFTLSLTVTADISKDPPNIEITGTVTNEDGEPLIGVNILVKDTEGIGTTSDFDGNYIISVPDDSEVLVFTYVGYKSQEVPIDGRNRIDVVMLIDNTVLDELVVVGFGTQKKSAMVGSMTTVNPSELKIPSSNLTTALAGRVAGMVSYQTTGEPGADNAQFFVRGVASFNNQNGPLILIDGVELTADDLARLQPDDIQSFSVLKDPTTTAIYGARGANGIILVTTKSGVDGPAVVNIRLENSFSRPNKLAELADPITYMRLQNEAGRTRGKFATHTEEKIKGTERGLNHYAFPAVDWYDELFRSHTSNQRFNMNVRGGGKKVRYYVAGSYTHDNGLLKSDPTNPFQSNIDLDRYLLRSNINIDLTDQTEMIVRLHSTIDNSTGPLQSGSAMYNAVVRTSPVRFAPVIEPIGRLVGVPHITFGNNYGPRGSASESNEAVWFNPYAELQRGYRDTRRQLSLVQLELKQNLASITEGLSFRFLGNVNSTSYFENRRSLIPFFYRVTNYNALNDTYNMIRTSEGLEALQYEPGERINNSAIYVESAINYIQTFNGVHNTQGLLVAIGREFLDANATTVTRSLPSRNLGISGRFNYDYDNKYFAEFNFGYNGSERFSRNNRYGFFPSFGLGYLISNEPFFAEVTSFMNLFKLRMSFGWVGNDNIGSDEDRADRFFYLSEVNLSDDSQGSTFGLRFNERIPGVSIARYANERVTWERARKANFGIDINFFDDAIILRADVFHELRTSILQTRSDIPRTLGLQAEIKTNVGEVTAHGFDGSLDFNYSFNPNLWVTGRSTFTYADNQFKVFEEPNYAAIDVPWVSRIGNNVNLEYGYIAERLFVDDEEALNSPVQFGAPGVDYGGGDIKYRDLNKDGVITTLDQAPIGKSTLPKITYGFGVSLGYKKFDLNIFLQGLSEVSFQINPFHTAPFLNTITGSQTGDLMLSGGNGMLSENGLLKAYADDHWSEENPNPYALWPRLSVDPVENNLQSSTWWLRDGSFIRLKQLEVGYTIINSESFWGISNLRAYVTGTNLITWSAFDLWDPELKGAGFNYPLQQVFNIGLHIGF